MKPTQYFVEVLALLAESKRTHMHCDDDCWYCCRACRHDDHILIDGEHLGEGADTQGKSFKRGDCTCGAAEWNNKVDALLRKFETRFDGYAIPRS